MVMRGGAAAQYNCPASGIMQSMNRVHQGTSACGACWTPPPRTRAARATRATTRGTRCWTRSTACTPPSRASRRVGSTNPPCATPGRRRRFRSSFFRNAYLRARKRLEKTGRVSNEQGASAAATTTTTRARVTKEKKREALRSWLRAPFAFMDAPFAAEAVRRRGWSFATAARARQRRGADAEAELAAALARPVWAMGGANDTTRRVLMNGRRAPRPASQHADWIRFGFFGPESPGRVGRRPRRVDDVAPAATRITSAVSRSTAAGASVRRELKLRVIANALAGRTSGSVLAKGRRRFRRSAEEHATSKSREDHFRRGFVRSLRPRCTPWTPSRVRADVVVISAVRCNARGRRIPRGPAEAERGADEGEERVRLRGVRPHVARVRLGRSTSAGAGLREPGTHRDGSGGARVARAAQVAEHRRPSLFSPRALQRVRRADAGRLAQSTPPVREKTFFSSVEDPSEIRPSGTPRQ